MVDVPGSIVPRIIAVFSEKVPPRLTEITIHNVWSKLVFEFVIDIWIYL